MGTDKLRIPISFEGQGAQYFLCNPKVQIKNQEPW